jgi:hypothetical protein
LTILQDRFVIFPQDVDDVTAFCSPIGNLNVYDLRQASSTSSVHNPGPVASLQLPRLKRDDTHNYVKTGRTSFRCSMPVVSQSHCPSLYRSLPKLYDLDGERGEVCLIGVNVDICEAPGSPSGTNATGVLCIPSSVFSSVLLSHSVGSSSGLIIPWELWGKGTTWLSVPVFTAMKHPIPYVSGLTTTIETRLPGSIVLWDFSPLRLWLSTSVADGEQDQTSTNSSATVDNEQRVTFADDYLESVFSAGQYTKASRSFLRSTFELCERLTSGHSIMISDEHSKYTSQGLASICV